MPPLTKSERKHLEIAELDKAIAERKQYLRNQESLIIEMIEVGNARFKELNSDIMMAEKRLRELNIDIRTRSQDKVMLIRDIELLQVQIGILV